MVVTRDPDGFKNSFPFSLSAEGPDLDYEFLREFFVEIDIFRGTAGAQVDEDHLTFGT